MAELGTRALPEAGGLRRKLQPEAGALRFLRSYSHFLNPKGGLFSADTWSWIGIYLRNLSLNWLVLIPLLLLLVALPRLYASLVYNSELAHGDLFPWLVWVATLAVIFTLVCITVNRPSITDPVIPSRKAAGGAVGQATRPLLDQFKQQKWILVLGVFPAVVFAILLTLVVWGLHGTKDPFQWHQIWALLSGTPILELARTFAVFRYRASRPLGRAHRPRRLVDREPVGSASGLEKTVRGVIGHAGCRRADLGPDRDAR